LKWLGLAGAVALAAEEARVLEPSREAIEAYQRLAAEGKSTRLVRLIRSRDLSLCIVLSRDPE
jgi:hypothetical protein